ncbi:alpha-amylase family glycosyl hydrolase [Jeotgalibaca sp. A127]|uniref:alpha-amylase family glycosyl hydrolase n=1 Tax=Jeotgalibaca sp. A127 TaxID=3457324 RepID=UPI003FD3C280
MNRLKYILPILTLGLFACTSEDENAVAHYPEKPTVQDSVLVRIDPEVYYDENVENVTLDASDLGVPNDMIFDEQLNELSVAIEDDVEIGEKTVRVTIATEEGTETYEEAITLVASEDKNDGLDFSWDEARIYFALTDRFYNGDPTNDDPGNRQYDTTHPETYHGGDFRGLIDKMPYLQDLGINTLWITPIVDNIEWNMREEQHDNQYGYHGYWTKDFTKIDEHLGDLATFKELIDTAHDHGIKLMVDVVLNHAGYKMAEGETPFEGMLREEPIPHHPVLGELSGLPDFKTEEEAVREQLVSWQTAWIEETKTERGDTIDFFRVDTIKHVEDTTWKAFKNAVIKEQPDFKFIGEHYGASIANTGGYYHDGEMDSLLDFEFKSIAGSFVNWDVVGANDKLIARNEQLTSDATLGQFLSSHDEDGFLYRQAGGDRGKQKVAASLLITAKGQPVIYYGEELGQTGATAKNMDKGEYSENRYDFDWDSAETSDMRNHYKELLQIRKDHSLVFSKGNRETVAGSNEEGYIVFSRGYKKEELFIGLNILDEPTVFSMVAPAKKMTDLYSGTQYQAESDGTITVTLPPKSEGGTVILSISEN